MPQPTFFVSYPFASLFQEPKSASDTPAGVGTGGTGTAAPAGPNAAPATGVGGGGGDTMFIWMGLILLAMYFLLMRPEQKRKKQVQAMLSAIKQGDRVVTLGGMHGTVASLSEKTVTLRIDTVKMVFDRVAIARVERDEPQAGEAPKT